MYHLLDGAVGLRRLLLDNLSGVEHAAEAGARLREVSDRVPHLGRPDLGRGDPEVLGAQAEVVLAQHQQLERLDAMRARHPLGQPFGRLRDAPQRAEPTIA